MIQCAKSLVSSSFHQHIIHRSLSGLISRRWVSQHHVCVIGSGPAGFYVAQHLLKLLSPSARVDIFEKLPVPFGLVRYGVAPDHPEVKNVINSFNAVLAHDRVRFVGNVDVGAGFGLGDILSNYHGVVMCYGATSDKLLGIKNEEHVTSAREFVGWYNGLPSNSDLPVDLRSARRVVVIGHGNVALDIARILLTDVKKLEGTDIADYALEELKASSVKEVLIVGRRGVLQVSFTIKEFREMVKLDGVSWTIDDVDAGCDGVVVADLPRPRKRLTELIMKSASEGNTPGCSKTWTLKFLRSPVAITKERDGKLLLKFEVNRLQDNGGVVGTGEFEEIPCDIAFRSIGYKGVRVFNELPFDHESGVLINDRGRVLKGIYCSGWAGQGPRGVILSTMQNAFEVAKLVASDLESGVIGGEPKLGFDGLVKSGALDKIEHTCYNDYKRIAEWEVAHGKKITRIDDMISVCKRGTL